jgi:uncharacterized RDD family membrane protein YckC
LLEFPKRVGATAPAVAAPALPAWRVELNEKVRAIRAKRASEAPGEDRQQESMQQAEIGQANAPAATARAAATTRQQVVRSEISSQSEPVPAGPTRRSSSNIVEAALTRVKRASENASRAALPKIEPARPVTVPQMTLSVDRQATARALEPVPEPEPRIGYAPPAPLPVARPASIARPANVAEPGSRSIARPANIGTVAASIARPANVGVTQSGESAAQPIGKAEAGPPPAVVEDESLSLTSVAEEIEPLDYLEAEIRKVDKTLGAQFVRNESPSLFTHAVIGIVDLIVIGGSCSPFLAAISISNGSFSSSQTWVAAAIVVGFVAFFYLALTQCLSGKTFGMMLTNTRVVDSLMFETPSASRALVRTASYFAAAAPGLLGFFWAAFNRKHRGLHDVLSGTIVVRDF